jgi:hypothetical protein
LNYKEGNSHGINDSIYLLSFTFAAMKFSWLLFFGVLGVSVFSSCEKELNIPIEASEPRLVVEGSIANDQQPVVALTKTIGFFDKIELENIQFVNDAKVWVTDLSTRQRIELFPITIDLITIYTINPTDPLFADFERGVTNRSYKLEIQYENQQYSSVATIPSCDGLDSLYFEKETRFEPEEVYKLVSIFTDPDTPGNFYKYFTKRNGNGINQTEFFEPFTSRFDDVFINGKTLPADLFLGFNNSDTVVNEFSEKRSYSLAGDTIVVKLSAMDANVYDFYKTLEFAEGSVGNPFSSPIQVQSNVTNEAYGVWAGFGNAYDTVINNN